MEKVVSLNILSIYFALLVMLFTASFYSNMASAHTRNNKSYFEHRKTKATVSLAYVANTNSNSVSVIDTKTNIIKDTIIDINQPGAVAVSPDGKRVYVTEANASVAVIDTTSKYNSIVDSVVVNNSNNLLFDLAVAPDGKRVYVAMYGNSETSNITVIDTTSHPNRVIDRIFVEIGPISVAVSPDGKRVYSANLDGHTVSVIDTTASPNTVLQKLDITYPSGVAVSPNGKRVYVTEEASAAVSVIDTTTSPNTVIDRITGFSIPRTVTVSPDGKRVYVEEEGGNSIAVIDTTTQPNMIVDRITGIINGQQPIRSMAMSPDGNRIFVTEWGSNNVAVINTKTQPNSVIKKLIGFNGPSGIAISPTPIFQNPIIREHCKHNSWKNFHNPIFGNQEECFKFINEHHDYLKKKE